MAAAAATSTDMAPPTVTQNKHRAHRKHPMITPRGTGRLHPRRCPVSGDGSGTVVIGFAHASEQKRARRRSDTRRGSCQRPSLPSLCPVADGNCRDERAVLRCRRRPILHPNMAGRSRKIYIRTGDRPKPIPEQLTPSAVRLDTTITNRRGHYLLRITKRQCDEPRGVAHLHAHQDLMLAL
jgi:hypothetical protein